jgi:hypothetical protein
MIFSNGFCIRIFVSFPPKPHALVPVNLGREAERSGSTMLACPHLVSVHATLAAPSVNSIHRVFLLCLILQYNKGTSCIGQGKFVPRHVGVRFNSAILPERRRLLRNIGYLLYIYIHDEILTN